MKTIGWIVLLVLAGTQWARAGDATFWRVSSASSASPSVVLTVDWNGTLAWSNAVPGQTYQVQRATSLISATEWQDFIQVPATGATVSVRVFDPNLPQGMALIPAGSFSMGDNAGDGEYDRELPVHTVYVSGFYMDRYEVTNSQWDEVANWAASHGYDITVGVGSGKAADHPGGLVTWYDCVKWCNARSEKELRIPAYYTSSARTAVYRSGFMDVRNDWVRWDSGYRLPTEAEWEKAARGGLNGQRFPWGDWSYIDHSRANNYSYWDAGVPWLSYEKASSRGHHPEYDDGG